MTSLKSVSTSALRALIEETEVSLQALRTELVRREQLSQHDTVERLETHLKHAAFNIRTLKDFINFLLAEMRSDRDGREEL